MKKITMILLIAICAFQAQAQKRRSDALQAKDVVKNWLISWDNNDSTRMKMLSDNSTTMKHIQCIIKIHNNETPKNTWSKVEHWRIVRDTIPKIDKVVFSKIPGYLVTATLSNGENIPFFVQKNRKGQWVVNVRHSELCIEEQENDY